jgi:predicted nucleic-acid-binding protein
VIALDTNVLVRLLVEDDEKQLAKALAVLEPRWERGEKAFVSDVALAELGWVLDAAYEVPRRAILAALISLARDDRFAFTDLSRLRASLARYQDGKGDLSDYLLGSASEAAGATTTLTFDRALRGEVGFTLL